MSVQLNEVLAHEWVSIQPANELLTRVFLSFPEPHSGVYDLKHRLNSINLLSI